MKKLTKVLGILSMVFMLGACSSNNNTNKTIDFGKTMDIINEKAEKEEIFFGMTGENPDEATLKELYNIDSEMISEYYVAIPMINIQANEIAMFKVKEGKMDLVKQGVEKRVKDLESNWSQYLVDQYEIVKDYKVYESGDYYFMVISEDASKILDIIKSEFK